MAQDIELNRALSHPLAAGLAGAILGLKWAPGASWAERALNVGGGAAAAGYIGPLACALLGFATPSAQAAIGFALGLFGLSLAGALMDGIKSLALADILKSWLTRR